MAFAGKGRKRPLLDIEYSRLFLDTKNPRLPENIQGKKENDLLLFIKKGYYLEELAQSMASNGYLDEEPLVAIPINLDNKFLSLSEEDLRANKEYQDFIENPTTQFTVVEGNRRLSTVKLLLSGGLSSFKLTPEIAADLKILPVIIYPKRDDVLAYLGVRHINPVRKWDAYAKARYIAELTEKYGLNIDDVQKRIGDTSNSARKTYICYKLIKLMESEFDYDSKNAKDRFSFLILATGQSAIKRYIGLPENWNEVTNFDNIIEIGNRVKLKNLFNWIYGDGDNLPIIKESRDITNKISPILRNANATTYLEEVKDIEGAYDRSDGDSELLTKYFRLIYTKLNSALPLVMDYEGGNDNFDVMFNDVVKRLEQMKNQIEKK